MMPRIRKLLAREPSSSTVGIRRDTEHTRNADVIQEDALRAMLNDDPNNERAFEALVKVVCKHLARSGDVTADPLTPTGQQEISSENDECTYMSTWALAEELSGHPRAWFPLTELARLSLEEDPEDALRRLTTSVARDDTGQALGRSIAILRDHGLVQEAYSLGLGHWRAHAHVPHAGIQFVRAALDCGRVEDADKHLQDLLAQSTNDDVLALDPELISAVKKTRQQQ